MAENIRYRKYEPLFGSWYIKGMIGKGAIGQVFEIEREDLGTRYHAALKAITIPESAEEIKRVLSCGVPEEDLVDYYRNLINKIANEFQYLAKLKGNSYIVNYEDHQIIENIDEMRWDVLIKTELLKPLVEQEIDQPLTEQDVLRLGIDICRALKYCGQYNILHRDIKPENIFISPGGDYKLGDFGIARVVEETYIDLSRKGTYTYMAPEVFHGQKYDQKADLYSLGLVMYKLLNHGRIPFMPQYPEKIAFDDTEKAFAERMSGRTLPKPQTGAGRLCRIVLKACAYEPSDRYDNAEEMLADLEALNIKESKKHSGARHHKRREKEHLKPDPAQKPEQKPEQKSGQNPKQMSKNKKEKISGDSSWTAKRFRIAGAVAALLLLTGAGIYAYIPKEVTDIKGIDSSISMYYDGSLSPEYTIEPEWFKDETISFASGNDKVFTVNDSGKLNAVSIGEADLTMKAKEYSETVHVKVVPKVTDITGIEDSYNILAGSSIRLQPVLEPEKFSGEPVSYKSSDESVAAVDEEGTITAVSPGEVVITITAGGTVTEAAVNVTAPVPVIRRNSHSGSKSRKSESNSSGNSTKESFGDEEYF